MGRGHCFLSSGRSGMHYTSDIAPPQFLAGFTPGMRVVLAKPVGVTRGLKRYFSSSLVAKPGRFCRRFAEGVECVNLHWVGWDVIPAIFSCSCDDESGIALQPSALFIMIKA